MVVEYKLMKSPAIDSNHDPRVRKQDIWLLKRFYVFVSIYISPCCHIWWKDLTLNLPYFLALNGCWLQWGFMFGDGFRSLWEGGKEWTCHGCPDHVSENPNKECKLVIDLLLNYKEETHISLLKRTVTVTIQWIVHSGHVCKSKISWSRDDFELDTSTMSVDYLDCGADCKGLWLMARYMHVTILEIASSHCHSLRVLLREYQRVACARSANTWDPLMCS